MALNEVLEYDLFVESHCDSHFFYVYHMYPIHSPSLNVKGHVLLGYLQQCISSIAKFEHKDGNCNELAPTLIVRSEQSREAHNFFDNYWA